MKLIGFWHVALYTFFVALLVLGLCRYVQAAEVYVEGGAGLTQFLRTADDGVWRQEGLGSKTDWQDMAFRAGIGLKLNESWSIGTNYIRLGTVKIASQFVADEDYDAIRHVCKHHCAEAPSGHVWGTVQGGELIGTYHPQLWAVSPIVRAGLAVFDHTVRWQVGENPTVHQYRGVIVAGVVGAGACYQQWLCVDTSYYRGFADSYYPVSSGAVVSMLSLKYAF